MKSLLLLILICSTAFSQFQVGNRVEVVSGISCVNVRPIPGPSTPLGCKVPGTLGTVLAGPTLWGTVNYYNVRYDDGLEGWSAVIYLKAAVVQPVPPPFGTLSVSGLPGPVVLSFSSTGDTAVYFQGIPLGPYSGQMSIPLTTDRTFSMTLYGLGGSVTYTASTQNGTPPVLPVDLQRMLDSAYNAGLSAVGITKIDVLLSNGRLITK